MPKGATDSWGPAGWKAERSAGVKGWDLGTGRPRLLPVAVTGPTAGFFPAPSFWNLHLQEAQLSQDFRIPPRAKCLNHLLLTAT